MARKRRKSKQKPTATAPVASSGPVPSATSIAAPVPVGEASLVHPHTRPLLLDTRLMLQAVALVLALGLLWQLRELATTFLFAAVLVFLGAPLVARLQERGIPRAAGTGIFLAAALGVLGLMSLIIVPALVTDLRDLFDKLPAALAKLDTWARATFNLEVPVSLSELAQQIYAEIYDNEQLAQGATKALSTGGKAIGKSAGAVWGFVMGAVGAAGRAVFIPVLAFFALTELPEIARFARQLAPQHVVRTWEGTLGRINTELTSLVKGQLTVAAILAGVYAVGLWLAGVPLSLGIAILAGFGYLIPFASAPICVVLSILFTLLEVPDGMVVPIVGSVVVAAIVQLVEGWILTPRVVGDSAGLSPLAVVLAVTVAGSLVGFIGVLFALPVATAIGVVLKEKALKTA